MGLDCSHDAFHGAYSTFNRFRQICLHAIGGSFPPHYTYNTDGSLVESGRGYVMKQGYREDWMYWPENFESENYPGLSEFFIHSDCDGEISPEMCELVANELESLVLPEVKKLQWYSPRYTYTEMLERFIAGCRSAHKANEPLEFS